MGVHNLAEYVAYHQAKLRAQSQSESDSIHTPPKPTSTRKPTRKGVNPLTSKSSFQTSVISGSSSHLVLLDCFATWCGPCKMIAPKIATMSTEDKYKDSVEFYKIDVDEVPDVAQELNIRAMPTFLLFKDGEKVEEVVGANEKAIRAAVDKYL
jgi:thioredoxin 1